MRSEAISFSQVIGTDPLIVQGAGGNLSWKEGDVLWIKASGTWLGDAAKQDIFVPVDLASLRQAIKDNDFNVVPRTIGITALRPSIETLLHALMPQPVVVHLHAVDILACLVRKDSMSVVSRLVGCDHAWASVPYCKPGADLARAVFVALSNRTNIQIAFLQNHGVVLAGESLSEVSALLQDTIAACKSEIRQPSERPILEPLPLDRDGVYSALNDVQLQQLALDDSLFYHLKRNWVLYPDHAVFLGAEAVCYNEIESFISDPLIVSPNRPPLVFVRGSGIYITSEFSRVKHVQLACYYEVLRRQPMHAQLKSLTQSEIFDLLNWDAEKYRMSFSKTMM